MDRIGWYKSLNRNQRREEVSKFVDSLGFSKTAKSRNRTAEIDIELAFSASLKRKGVEHRRQVHCAAGIVDIMTKETIYEIKNHLTRDVVFKAIGQLFAYQLATGISNLAIVGRSVEETKALLPYIKMLGIEVIEWK